MENSNNTIAIILSTDENAIKELISSENQDISKSLRLINIEGTEEDDVKKIWVSWMLEK